MPSTLLLRLAEEKTPMLLLLTFSARQLYDFIVC
jgi:hypothetical protein